MPMIPLNTLWCTEEKRLAWKYLDCSNLRNEGFAVRDSQDSQDSERAQWTQD